MQQTQYNEIVVIGAGFGGLGTGVSLEKYGLKDFVILERADDVGGTWRDNTYPGLTVDVPTLIYSFSFKQNPNWSSLFAPQPELLDYCRQVADEYDLRRRIVFNSEVMECRYDPDENLWHTETASGIDYTSRYLISATGFLSTPKWPDIEGLDSFKGKLIHTSAWPDDYDFVGKRVGFIGTGATGVQLIPEIAARNPEVLHVFQRTPIWLLPKADLRVPNPVKFVFRHIPGAMWVARLLTAAFMDLVFFNIFINYKRMRPVGKFIERIQLRHLRRQVSDPQIAEQLTPPYDWCCKRPSFSNVFYPVFNQDNVELVSGGIERITPAGIVGGDGAERELDVLICATGYQPWAKRSMPTFPVYGADGTDLIEYWDKNRYQAYHGFAVNGYPNYFLICGPYSIAQSSYVGTVETVTRYIARLLKQARHVNADYVEVKAAAQQREHEYNLAVRENQIFFTGNCAHANTYYLDRFGDTPNFRPRLHPRVWAESRFGRIAKDFVLANFRSRRTLASYEKAV